MGGTASLSTLDLVRLRTVWIELLVGLFGGGVNGYP